MIDIVNTAITAEEESKVTVIDCIFSNNYADDTPCIFAYYADVNVKRSNFTNNGWYAISGMLTNPQNYSF